MGQYPNRVRYLLGSLLIVALALAGSLHWHASAQAAGESVNWCVAGDFNGWNNSSHALYDDATNGDFLAGDGVYARTITVPNPGIGEFKVVECGNWNQSFPNSNAWLSTSQADQSVVITFDTNDRSGDAGPAMLPGQNIVNAWDEPPLSFTAVGSFQGWVNDNPDTLMTDLGNGLHRLAHVIPDAGEYIGKVVITGSWNAIGSDGRGVDAGNVTFTTTEANQTVIFLVDQLTGRVMIAPNGSSQGNWCVAGGFQGWDNQSMPLFDTGENGDILGGDGIFSRNVTIPEAGRYEFKVVECGNWDNAFPGSNAWLNTADEDQVVTITFDTNDRSGDAGFPLWPQTNVVNAWDSLPQSFTAVGSFQGWNNANPDTAMTSLGNGWHVYSATLAAGDYIGKVTVSGTWDAVGKDGRGIDAANIDFTVAAGGQPVQMAVDARSGRANLLPLAVSGDPVPTPTPTATPDPGDIEYVVIRYHRHAGDYGNWASNDFNDFWGLHLWGDAICDNEGTEWSAPKKFSGIDDYGAYVAVCIQDASQPVNFIIHKGDEKDTPPDRSFMPAQFPMLYLIQGDTGNYASWAEAKRSVTIRYQRPDNDYDGWGLHLWGDAIHPDEATEWAEAKMPDGVDSYGAYWHVALNDSALRAATGITGTVNFIVHKGDEKDPANDDGRSFDPKQSGQIFLQSGDMTLYTQRAAAEGKAIIHYHRFAGDYGDPTSQDFNDFWGLHLWTGSAEPGITWDNPLRPAGTDAFGVYWEVDLQPEATQLAYIIHRGDEKDPGPDQFLVFANSGHEIWQIQGSGTQYSDPAVAWYALNTVPAAGNLGEQRAYWLSQDLIVWPGATDSGATVTLHTSGDASLSLGDEGISGGSVLTLTYHADSISGSLAGKFPHLMNQPVWRLPEQGRARADVAAMLKGQFAVALHSGEGDLLNATGLQIPGVLDDLYTYDGELGVIWNSGAPTVKLWAPTAQSVTLHVFDDATAAEGETFPMTWDPATGVWSHTGQAAWKHKFYLFEINVFVPSEGAIVTNIVTDPYSLSLAMNSVRSQFVDLTDPSLIPSGWGSNVRTGHGMAPEDITVYEIHMRDFSAFDETVPEELRGTYKAFTLADSDGINHLKALRAAGLTHIHLLPVFDIATINEDKSQWQQPDFAALAQMAPDSEDQQAAVAGVAGLDPFNWGYDPFHYTTPEGSYSTDPNGVTRIVEFREMVQALHDLGFHVVMDVVYNHTNASGQSSRSVLDRIVPGYYHRLNDRGQVETSTCCPNTATEHAMMEKLMVDSMMVWAEQYKIDSFRFDLMGHHMVSNILAVRQSLDTLTPAQHGVDGSAIYLYGEGWNFGEVVDNSRGINATQANMAGTGVGTFSDRLRDAVRGGSPFDSGQALKNQGWATGLLYDPNGVDQGDAETVRDRYLNLADIVRLGLAGNLRDYEFIGGSGELIRGSEVDYNGSPAGYTMDPQEHVLYVSKHDNQTLFDNNVYRLPVGTSMDDRVRTQIVALSTVLLGQGVPFIHAGADILRSKSLDRDSYDSGDWFNSLDWTYQDNGWGRGLPVAEKNQENWDIMRPLLANPALMPQPDHIARTNALFRELLEIRYSSPLFRLQTAAEVQQRIAFHNTGPEQIPGLIVMSLDDTLFTDVDPNFEMMVVAFNASGQSQSINLAGLAGRSLILHPVQQNSADPVVKTAAWNPATAALTVPARTTVVFVEEQVGSYEYILPLIFKNAYWGSSDEARSLVTPPVMHPTQDDIFYFVLPDRFDNGDTSNDFGGQPGGETVEDILRHGFLPTDKGYYHGGDLAGLMDRLDYLEALGVTAIWMTPVFENRPVQGDGTIAGSSAAYHGYWITNFDRVEPRLGTHQELAALIGAAHSRGMKVFFDIVTNHTGDVIRYEEGEYTYRSLADYPYRDANGNIFDPADYAGTDTFPPLDPAVSFPYTPVFDSPADAAVKSPAWLNDPIYYHNRGDSTFAGESSLFGDFFGLDDLFTQHPAVVDGMIDIYKSWISDYRVDGFRIDTVKHVNIEFWQKFAPEIMAHAQAEGIDHFYMFGEVFDGNPAVMSHFTTVGQLPATLDFGLQGRAVGFAGGGNAGDLAAFFAADDYYTDADSSAYGLANFTGNHDMGRAAWMLRNQVSGATESELIQRTMLAYGLVFFARGFPVIYYGDEQGFIGEGGDKDARQNMMPSQVASYNANNLLGTDATTADANFDQNHPMFRQFRDFANVRTAHKALSQGSQIHRYAANGAGIYAFSRFDREERVEYIVALNNAKVPNRATFPTYSINGSFVPVYPASGPTLTTTDQGMISVDVPPLSLVIYRASAPIHRTGDLTDEEARRTPTTMRFINPRDGVIAGRGEVGVDLIPDRYTEVTFAVKVDDAAEWTILGTDTNYPYRVFYDVSSLPISATLRFMAVANGFTDRLWTAQTEAVVVEESSTASAGYAVIHYHRPDGDYDGWGLHLWGDAIAGSEATTWQEAKLPNGESNFGKFWFVQLQDASQPVNFIIHKGDEKDTDPDRSFIPAQDREIWVFSGNETNHPSMAAATGQVIIHYQRTDGDYDGWGLHLWGPGLDPGAETEWNDAKLPDGEDEYGKYFIVPISNPAQPVNFIIHKGDEKDTEPDRSFVPNERPEIWLLQGQETIYSHPGAVEGYAILHYHRPDGDYEGWGLHLWAGSAEPGVEWTAPFQPTGMDAFGQVYRVRLTQNAQELAYILHKGDEKDLPEDQLLRLRQDGHEVWIVQGTPGYLPVTPNRLPQ